MTFQWNRRPCLVTGGAGFGGAHLCRELVALGARVYVFDLRLAKKSPLGFLPDVASRIEFLQGDVLNLSNLALWLQRLEIRTLFHLAAQPIVPISNCAPLPTLMTNAVGTYNALEASRNSPFIEEFVLASSGAYYGTTYTEDPIEEDTAPVPATNIYAPSKVAADSAAQSYALTFGMNIGICRFMNTYGPGDTNFSRLVPKAIRKLMEAEPYDFGDRDDGTTELDFLHVSDMALGYIKMAEAATKYPGRPFNFGSGYSISTSDMARRVSRVFDGVERAPIFTGTNRNRPIKKRLKVDNAITLLGWKPRFELEQGLGETIEWYRKYWTQI